MYYDMKECGKRIQQLRTQRGYTQEQLAREVSIDRSLLSYIEAGKKGCSVDTLVQLSELFDVSLDYLVLGIVHLDPSKTDVKNIMAGKVDELIHQLEAFKLALDIRCDK